MNLTRKVFSKDVSELLNKNINFCPVQGEFNRLNLTADLQRFFRRIRLRAHFEKPDPSYTPSQSELFVRHNKTWTPKFNDHTVDTFVSCVTKELEESKPNLIPKDNLTGKKRRV